MKISIVLRDITENGGGERVCANLANLFSTTHQVSIISYYKSQDKPTYYIDPKVKIHYLSNFGEKSKNKLKTLFLKHIYRYFLTLKAIKIFCNDEIIIANDRALANIKKDKNKKYIRLWHLDFKKKDLTFFDHLVILSSKQINLWQKIHPSVFVIPNFITNLPKQITNYSQKYILSAGRLSKEKGFIRLIEIYTKIAEEFKDWKLIILGSGALQKEIMAKIAEEKMQDYILLKPFNPNIQEEFLKCSIYAMSSFFEGFGMVLVESASYGIPSIAFDVNTGPSDIICDKKTGFLITDNDYDTYANKLRLLMQNQELRECMGKNAKEYVGKKFCKEKILKLWEQLFI